MNFIIQEATVIKLNYTIELPYTKLGQLGRFLRWFLGYTKKYYIQPTIGISFPTINGIRKHDLLVIGNGDRFLVDWKKNKHAIVKMTQRKETKIRITEPRSRIYKISSGTRVAVLGNLFKEG